MNDVKFKRTKKNDSKQNIANIESIAKVTANKVYDEKPKELYNTKILAYLSKSQHEKLMRFTTENKLLGKKFSSGSILIRHLLDEFFEENNI